MIEQSTRIRAQWIVVFILGMWAVVGASCYFAVLQATRSVQVADNSLATAPCDYRVSTRWTPQPIVQPANSQPTADSEATVSYAAPDPNAISADPNAAPDATQAPAESNQPTPQTEPDANPDPDQSAVPATDSGPAPDSNPS